MSTFPEAPQFKEREPYLRDKKIGSRQQYEPAQIPMNKNPFSKKVETDKKKDKNTEELLKDKDFQEKLRKLLKESEEKEKKEEDEKVEIKYIEFSPAEEIYILPKMGAIQHPIWGKDESATNKTVLVCSQSWLKCLDEMRAARYNKQFIDFWLEESAKIVERDTLYNVRKDGVNHIEEFAKWFPERSRQKERLDINYGRLIQDMRKQSKTNPFLPTKLKDGKFGPPKFDFNFGGKRYRNFLRNWTVYDPNVKTIDFHDGILEEVAECSPPIEIQYSWIPEEHREDIIREYSLHQFTYVNPSYFKNMCATLARDENAENGDAFGTEKIMINGTETIVKTVSVITKGNKAYKMFLGTIKLNYSHDPTNQNRKWMSLRDWIQSKKEIFDDENNEAILAVILNAPAPNLPSNSEFNRYIYSNFKDESGNQVRRMYSDAPVELFQVQLLKKYFRKGEQDCKESFVQRFYIDCIRTQLNENLSENYIPTDYREIIESIFEIKNNQSCYNQDMEYKFIIQPSIDFRNTKFEKTTSSDVQARALEAFQANYLKTKFSQ